MGYIFFLDPIVNMKSIKNKMNNIQIWAEKKFQFAVLTS